MNKIKIYTVIPYFSNNTEVFLNDVKSFTTYEKAEYYLYELKRKSINADNSIICFGCKTKMDLSDCSDYWYSGVENNEEFI